jgi:hypothetical protein
MISGAASRMGRPVRIDPCGRISQEDHPKATNYGRRKNERASIHRSGDE